MTKAPEVYWYEGTNTVANEIKNTVNYGTVDADSMSPTKVFYIWNNRGGTEDCSKMEEVTFTTRDRSGGDGGSNGNIVEAVRDNWFHVRVDSLNETAFLPVGKSGFSPTNLSGTKDLGTTGTTTNVNAATAQAWLASQDLALDTYVKPTNANGFIYRVVKAGTTDGNEPSSWATVEGNSVFDGTVEYVAIKIEKTPNAKEILGFANNTDDDGTNAELAGGNFVKISVYADVPITASAGKNLLIQRVSYRYV
ncbi:hypothetical protein R6U77_18280 [Lysinibacillus louembei]|uniref:Uncharacterized protein n=1 Tax=Lysinibacillus louembei TaxID=1470088 RepID=A0ABZ0RX25_9BACI|nr:hypothetical protein [Lysinibacillus louembei]WPK11816.1 hypothetical protein R6U77_18280 [Lysinibacillus louembei]